MRNEQTTQKENPEQLRRLKTILTASSFLFIGLGIFGFIFPDKVNAYLGKEDSEDIILAGVLFTIGIFDLILVKFWLSENNIRKKEGNKNEL